MKICQLEDRVGVKFTLQVKRKGFVYYKATIRNRTVQQFYAAFKAFGQVLQTQSFRLSVNSSVVNMSKWNLSKYLEFQAKITLIRS